MYDIIENKVVNKMEDFFKRYDVCLDRLEEVGFKKYETYYELIKDIVNGDFKLIIRIYFDGTVVYKLIEVAFEEEFPLVRLNKGGEFSMFLKSEIENVLTEIRDNCFKKRVFLLNQSNRIANQIELKYQSKPEFLWEEYDGTAIFRNSNSGKWFGIIMNVGKDKLEKGADSKEIEILNVKVSSETMEEALKIKGCYKGYHMNKKYWVSIVLDDSLSDQSIEEFIKESYMFSCLKNNHKKYR